MQESKCKVIAITNQKGGMLIAILKLSIEILILYFKIKKVISKIKK